MFTACILWAGNESTDPVGMARGDIVKIYRTEDVCNAGGTALRDPPSLTQPLGFIHVSTLAEERPIHERLRALMESPIIGVDDLPVRRRGCSVLVSSLPLRVRNDLNTTRESRMLLLGFLGSLVRRTVVNPADRLQDLLAADVALADVS